MADYFTITRDLAAPRELVFDAITKPEHFAVWFGTAAVEVPTELALDGRATRRRVPRGHGAAGRQPDQLGAGSTSRSTRRASRDDAQRQPG